MENAREFNFYGEMDLNLNRELEDAIVKCITDNGYSFIEKYQSGTMVRKLYIFNEKE